MEGEFKTLASTLEFNKVYDDPKLNIAKMKEQIITIFFFFKEIQETIPTTKSIHGQRTKNIDALCSKKWEIQPAQKV